MMTHHTNQVSETRVMGARAVAGARNLTPRTAPDAHMPASPWHDSAAFGTSTTLAGIVCFGTKPYIQRPLEDPPS